MKIMTTSIPVQDQDHALKFYRDVLGFVLKRDIPLGGPRWLTVVSPEVPDGVELLLEPNGDYPAMKALKSALVTDGIPYTAFQVLDVDAEYNRLIALGVKFTMDPTTMGETVAAVFDDTCGNLIQIYEIRSASSA